MATSQRGPQNLACPSFSFDTQSGLFFFASCPDNPLPVLQRFALVCCLILVSGVCISCLVPHFSDCPSTLLSGDSSDLF